VENEEESKEQKQARVQAMIQKKKNSFDGLVKSMFTQLKEVAIKMVDAKTEKDIDNYVFRVCTELMREITLFLPLSEAIGALNHSLMLLDKNKSNQLEPQDLDAVGEDFSS
jgi:hypothetical protein